MYKAYCSKYILTNDFHIQNHGKYENSQAFSTQWFVSTDLLCVPAYHMLEYARL